MNNDFLFFGSLMAVLFAAFLISSDCDIILWLASIFLLIVFVPLLVYSAYVGYRKP